MVSGDRNESWIENFIRSSARTDELRIKLNRLDREDQQRVLNLLHALLETQDRLGKR